METQINFYKGLKENLPGEKDQNSLYFTTDTGEVFLGNKQLGVPALLDSDVKLSSDLYTYVPIGNAQTANNGTIGSGSTISSSNPGRLCCQGDSLKDVFNTVFGVEQNVQPTINTGSVSLTITSTAGNYGGGEYGTSVSSTTVTYTIKLNNSATASYGYRCGGTETTTSNATFYYPATKGFTYASKTAQLKITLPDLAHSLDTSSHSSYLVATDSTNKILYCNFDSNKEFKFTVTLAAGNVIASSQNRYGQVKAAVKLGTPQVDNTSNATVTTDNSKIITKFLAYKPTSNIYEDSTLDLSYTLPEQTKSAITIAAGYVPYSWILDTSAVTENGNLPTTNKRQSAYTTININNADGTKKLYIYVPSSVTITDIKNNNQAAPFTCDSTSRSLKVNGQSTTFKIYHVNANVAAGNNAFTIAY